MLNLTSTALTPENFHVRNLRMSAISSIVTPSEICIFYTPTPALRNIIFRVSN